MSATTVTPTSQNIAPTNVSLAQNDMTKVLREAKKLAEGNLMSIYLRTFEEVKESTKKVVNIVSKDLSKNKPEARLRDVAQVILAFQEDLFDFTDESMLAAAKTGKEYFRKEGNAKKLSAELRAMVKKTTKEVSGGYVDGLIGVIKQLGAGESVIQSTALMSTKQLESMVDTMVSKQLKTVGMYKDLEREIDELSNISISTAETGFKGIVASFTKIGSITETILNNTDLALDDAQRAGLSSQKDVASQYSKILTNIQERLIDNAKSLDNTLSEVGFDTQSARYKAKKAFLSNSIGKYNLTKEGVHEPSVDTNAQLIGNIVRGTLEYSNSRTDANLHNLSNSSTAANYTQQFAERTIRSLVGDFFKGEKFSKAEGVEAIVNGSTAGDRETLNAYISAVNENLKLINKDYSLSADFARDLQAAGGLASADKFTTKTDIERYIGEQIGKIINPKDLLKYQFGDDVEVFTTLKDTNITLGQVIGKFADAVTKTVKANTNLSNLAKVFTTQADEEKQKSKRSVNQKFSNSKFGKILAELTAIFKVFEPLYKNQLSRSNQGLGGTSLASAGIGENSMSRATFMSGVSSSVIAETLKGKAFQAGVLGSTTAYGKMIGSTEGLDNYTRVGNKDDLAKLNDSIKVNAQRFGASLKGIDKPASELRKQFEGFNKDFGTTAEQFTSMMDDITNSDVMPSVMLTTSNWDTMLTQSITRMNELNTAYAKSGVTIDKLNRLREAELRLKSDPLSDRMSAAGDLINAANSVGMGALAPEIQQAFIMQDEKKIEQLVRSVTGGLQESYKRNPHLNVAADAGRSAIMNSPFFQAISADYNLLKQEKDADKLTAAEKSRTSTITTPGGLGTTVIEIRDLLNRIGGSDIFQVGKDTLISVGKLGGGMILLGAAQKMLVKMYSLGSGAKAAGGLGLGSKIKGLAGRSGGLLRGAGGLAMRGGAGLLRGGLGLLGMVNPWVAGAATLGALGYGAYSLYKNYHSTPSIQGTDQQGVLTNPRSPNSINNMSNKTYDDIEKAELDKQKMQEAHLTNLNAIRENTFAMLMALRDLDKSNIFNLSNSTNNMSSVVDPLGKLPTFNNKMNYYTTTNALA